MRSSGKAKGIISRYYRQNKSDLIHTPQQTIEDVLMIINKRHSINRPRLNDRIVPNSPHIILLPSIARLFEVIMQRGVEQAELRVQRLQVRLEVLERVLPELAHSEHLGPVRLLAHGLDEVRDEGAVDVLCAPRWVSHLYVCRCRCGVGDGGWGMGKANLDSIEPKAGRADLVDDPFAPLDDVGAGLGVAVVDVCSHCEVTIKGQCDQSLEIRMYADGTY